MHGNLNEIVDESNPISAWGARSNSSPSTPVPAEGSTPDFADVASALRRDCSARVLASRSDIEHAIAMASGPDGAAVPQATRDWLLDNQGLISDTVRQLLDVDWRAIAGPAQAAGNEMPALIRLSWDVVAQSRMQIDADSLTMAVEARQLIRPFRLVELWSVPSLLRLFLLEHLAHAARAIVRAGLALPAGETGNADTQTIAAIINSMRRIDTIDWSQWVEQVNKVDIILREADDFLRLDPESRRRYREAVLNLARRSGKSEVDTASCAVMLMKNATGAGTRQEASIGAYLLGSRRAELEAALGCTPSLAFWQKQRFAPVAWFAIAMCVGAITLAIDAIFFGLLAPVWQASAGTGVLMLALASFPASEGAMGLLNTLIASFVRPTRLVGYDFSAAVPADAHTLVAVPCLIDGREEIDRLVLNLELHFLANRQDGISFALLTDWLDAPEAETDEDRALLDYAGTRISGLNIRYGMAGQSRFHLLHRRRVFNPTEGVWMGWERKRGKLRELNRLLRGATDTSYLTGLVEVPQAIQYVVTLDADTRLLPDSVAKLAGKLHHPMNRPVLDETGRVIHGYSILQPRVTPLLAGENGESVFQKVFSADRGIDPYVFAISDIYQDLADEGTFTGKGIYHVDAFEAALGDRIAENAVLSHDLLEGTIARCALASDVELVEDFPARYRVDTSRHHRWTRGDWQLLPWIFTPGNGLSMLGRWKMIDNLRRSLVPIAWLAASILGWSWLPSDQALKFQAALTLALFVAPVLAVAISLLRLRSSLPPLARLRLVLTNVSSTFSAIGLRIVFLNHQALSSADAIVRAVNRTVFTRRRMLEWRATAQVNAGSGDSLHAYGRMMLNAPVSVLLVLGMAQATAHPMPAVAYPFLLAWVFSPLVAWATSRLSQRPRSDASEADKIELGAIARRTWRYFETFVTPERNFLPPDNFQETPLPLVAERTSPTNIGVYLLSAVSAHDIGWIGRAALADRLERTIGTLERAPKYRGHFFNWYALDTLEPLGPRYVSSVDSGNLAGHLLAVAAACQLLSRQAGAQYRRSTLGLRHMAKIVEDLIAETDRSGLSKRLAISIATFRDAIAAVDQKPDADALGRLIENAHRVEQLCMLLHPHSGSPLLRDLGYWTSNLVATCAEYGQEGEPVATSSDAALRQRFLHLGERSRRLAMGMDFRFLFRPERRLFSIGYNVDDGTLDESCYDLLASEARLTSLLAIAKGDVPAEHWMRLGRSVTSVASRAALLSWSGSMFEYLMPRLVMHEPRGSLLDQTNVLAIREQVRYFGKMGLPWGSSEAAYNRRDAAAVYQYSGFGVPTLGLKRGLGTDAVIAPYASLLASQHAPREALANLKRLRNLGAMGPFGYHDAVDFTPSRLGAGQYRAVIRNYMAHHHGMSIAAIANVVLDGRLRDYFHADPAIQAVAPLLHEKAPCDVPDRPRIADATQLTGRRQSPALTESSPAPFFSHDAQQSGDSDPDAIAVDSPGVSWVLLRASGSLGRINMADAATETTAAE